MTMRLMLRGLAAGAGLAAALVLIDAVLLRTAFGLQSMIIGVGTGGMLLLLALLMSLSSYYLASRGLMAGLRRRLLIGSIFTGAAAMACGFATAIVWFAAGHPWFR